MRYRFWSDGDEQTFEDGATARGIPIEVVNHVADVPPELFELAAQCNAMLDLEEVPTSTSGADGFQDQSAFSVRSDGAKQWGYTPTSVGAPMIMKTKRRSTRSQP